jgi:AsmA protein
MAAQLQYAGGVLTIPDLTLQADDTTASGSVKVRSFTGPAADFQLAVDQIDLDRYLPPPAEADAQEEKAKTPPPTPGSAATGAAPLPLEPLRQLDLNGGLTVGRLVVKGMQVQDVRLKLTAAKGLIQVQPIEARLYQGQYQGHMRLDASGERARISVDERLSGVQVGPLLKDLLGESRLSGATDLAFAGTMSGAGMEEWLRTLAGQARFQFAEGAVEGFNLARMVRAAQAKLRGEPPPPPEPERTDFSVIAGSLTVEDGVVRNQDLDAKTPLLRVTGAGKVNLIEQAVDYLLTVNVVETLKGQGGRELEDLKRIPIPVRIRGPWNDLGFSVDLLEAIKQSQGAKLKAKEDELKAKAKAEAEQQQQELERKLDKEAQEAQRKLEKKAGKALEGLFKQQ